MDHELAHYTESILDNLKEAFFAIDKKWQVKYWNQQAELLTCRKKEEIVGRNLWESFPDEVNSLFHEQYKKAFQTRQPVHFKNRYKAANKIFNVSAHPHGDLLSVGFLDVSSVERQEREYRNLRLKYNILTHAITEAVWDWERETDQIFWHGSQLKDMLGYNVSDGYTPVRFWSELIHPDDRSRVMDELDQAIQSGAQRWMQEYRVRKANGDYLFIRNHALLMKEHGDPQRMRMIGSLINIHSEATLQQRLLQEQETTGLLFEASPLAQFLVSVKNLKLLNANRAATDFYGYSKEEFLEMEIIELVEPQGRRELEKKLRGPGKQSWPAPIILNHLTKQGTIKRVTLHAKLLTHVDPDLALVTVQMNEENEKRPLCTEMARAHILGQETANDIIGKELHDNINQVLASTKLFIEVAEKNQQLRQEILHKCKQNLDYVIQEIRTLSHSLVAPDAKEMNLSGLIQEIAANDTLVNDFRIHLEIDERINHVAGEIKLSLFRIFQEQLNNIIRHASACDVWLKIRITHQIEMEIIDNGMGADLSCNKAGIGLRNMKSRAAAYDGTVCIWSEPEKGFILKVAIPLAGHDPASGPAQPAPHP